MRTHQPHHHHHFGSFVQIALAVANPPPSSLPRSLSSVLTTVIPSSPLPPLAVANPPPSSLPRSLSSVLATIISTLTSPSPRFAPGLLGANLWGRCMRTHQPHYHHFWIFRPDCSGGCKSTSFVSPSISFFRHHHRHPRPCLSPSPQFVPGLPGTNLSRSGTHEHTNTTTLHLSSTPLQQLQVYLLLPPSISSLCPHCHYPRPHLSLPSVYRVQTLLEERSWDCFNHTAQFFFYCNT